MIETSNQTFQLSPEGLALAQQMVKRYPEDRRKSALLPVLHLAQAENKGWLSTEVMDYVASFLNIQPIEVYEVATFYTMFNLKPVGRWVLEVCRTGPCQLRGSDELIAHLEKTLGCNVGGTSADGMFTLKTVECLASCGTAPVIQVFEKYHEHITADKADAFLAELRSQA